MRPNEPPRVILGVLLLGYDPKAPRRAIHSLLKFGTKRDLTARHFIHALHYPDWLHLHY